MLFDTEVCHSRLWSPGDTEYSPRKAESCSLGRSGVICIVATGLSFFNILLVCLKAPKKRRLDPQYGKRYYDSFEDDNNLEDNEQFFDEDSAGSYEEDVEGGDLHASAGVAAATDGMEIGPPPPPSTEDQTPIARNTRLPVLRRSTPPTAQSNISGPSATKKSNLSAGGGIQNAPSDDDSIKIEISLDGSGAIAHLTPKTSRSGHPRQLSGNGAAHSPVTVGGRSVQSESGENNLIDQCIDQLAKSFAAGTEVGIVRTEEEEEERKQSEEGI